jgi:hypothetical protein
VGRSEEVVAEASRVVAPGVRRLRVRQRGAAAVAHAAAWGRDGGSVSSAEGAGRRRGVDGGGGLP